MKPLTRCPQCTYPLKGLPADHRCPECGLHYDLQSQVWADRFPRKFIMVLVGGAAVVLFLVVPDVFWAFLQNDTIGMFKVIAVPFFVVGLIMMIREARHGLRVATLPEGLFVRIGKPTGVLHPWETIEQAFWDSTNRIGGVKFSGSSRPLYFRGIFTKQSDLEDFANEVRRRKQNGGRESCSGC